MPKKLSNILSTFALLLVVCFGLNSALLSAHHFSHEISEFLESTLEESVSESDNNHKAVPGSHNLINYNKPSPAKFISNQPILNQSKISSLIILIKNKLEIFGHKFQSHHHSKSSDCDLCFSSIFQSQILSLNLLTFLILLFCFVIAFFNRYLARQYFNYSNSARAPPQKTFLTLLF